METDWIEKLREIQERIKAREEEERQEAWEAKKAKAKRPFTEAIEMPIHSKTSALAWWMFRVPRNDHRKAFEQWFNATMEAVLDGRFGGLFELRKEPPAENAQQYAAFILTNWYDYNKYDRHLETAVEIVGRETVQQWLKEGLTQ